MTQSKIGKYFKPRCWRHFPFLALAKKKSLWRWWWWWYIQQKNIIHTHSAENCPNGNSSPSITGSPNAPSVPSPPFLQRVKYASVKDLHIFQVQMTLWIFRIKSMTPFAWVSWLGESEIFDSKSKSLPCFPRSWQTHYFWGKNKKYHKGR